MPPRAELHASLGHVRRHVELATGFTLLLVAADSPFTRWTAAQALSRTRNHGSWVHASCRTENFLDLIPPNRGREAPVSVVTGLEERLPVHGARTARFLEVLNVNRESLARRHPGPLILVLPRYLLGMLQKHAADFFSVRSAVAIPEELPWFRPWIVELPVLREAMSVRLLPRAEREIEAAQSLRRLAASAGQDQAVPGSLLIRTARILGSLGRRTEALELLARPGAPPAVSLALVRHALALQGWSGDASEEDLERHVQGLLELRQRLAAAELLRDAGRLVEAQAALGSEPWTLAHCPELLAYRATSAGILFRASGPGDASDYWRRQGQLDFIPGVRLDFGPDGVAEVDARRWPRLSLAGDNWELEAALSLVLELGVAGEPPPSDRLHESRRWARYPTVIANFEAARAGLEGRVPCWRSFRRAWRSARGYGPGTEREVLSLLGQSCLMLGDARSALRILRKAAQLEPSSEDHPDAAGESLALALAALAARRRGASTAATAALGLVRRSGSAWRVRLVRNLLRAARDAPRPPRGAA